MVVENFPFRKTRELLIENDATRRAILAVPETKSKIHLSTNSLLYRTAAEELRALVLEIGEPNCLINKTRALGRSWSIFVQEVLLPAYRRVTAEQKVFEGTEQAKFLYWPLYAQRAVAHALRELDRDEADLLTCIHPVAFYSHRELYDPVNLKSEESTREYYRTLARVFARFAHEQASVITSQREFFQLVKTPYREFCDLESLFELEIVEESLEARPIALLNSSVAIADMKLRQIQLERLANPNTLTQVPKLGIESLRKVHRIWSRERSSEFFVDLPSCLFSILRSEDAASYSAISQDLLSELRTAEGLSEKLSSIVAVPEEFKDDATPVNARGENQEDMGEDLRQVFKAQLALRDLKNDIENINAFKKLLSYESKNRPWAEEEFHEVSRELSQTLQLLRVKQESLNDSIETIRSQSLEQNAQAAIERIRTTIDLEFDKANADVPRLSSRLNLLLPKALKKLRKPWDAKKISDPIAWAHYSMPSHRSRHAEIVRTYRAQMSYGDIVSRVPQAETLLDLIAIESRIESGQDIAQIAKEYPTKSVLTVAIRNAIRDEGLGRSELHQRFPKSRMLVTLIYSREEWDQLLEAHCACLEQLFREYYQNFSTELSRLENTNRFATQRTHRKAFAIVWAYYLSQVPNPYSDVDLDTESEHWDAQRKKHAAFRQWFERQLAEALHEHIPGLYNLLVLERPSAIFDELQITELINPTSAVHSHYLRTIAAGLLEVLGEVTPQDTTRVLRAYVESLGSPFALFANDMRFDVSIFAQKFFNFSAEQMHTISTERKRELIYTWAAMSELSWYGTAEQSGAIYTALIDAVYDVDSLLAQKIVSAIADETAYSLRRTREQLKHREETPSTITTEELETLKRVNQQQLERMDAIREKIRTSIVLERKHPSSSSTEVR